MPEQETQTPSEVSTIPIPGTPPPIIDVDHCNLMIKYWIYRMNVAATLLRGYCNKRIPSIEEVTPINQHRDAYRDAKRNKEVWEELLHQLSNE